MYKTLDNPGYRFAPRIGRVLIRAFWTYQDLSVRRLKGHAYEVALGLSHAANHVPFINDICHRIIRLCEAENIRPYVDRETKQKKNVLELRGEHCGPVSEHPDTMSDICEMYRIDFTLAEDYRGFLREWTWGQDLSPAKYWPIIDSFYENDVA